MGAIVMKYFVLKPRSKTINDDYAFASRQAMRTFASYCNDPQLADELRSWVDVEDRKVKQMMTGAK